MVRAPSNRCAAHFSRADTRRRNSMIRMKHLKYFPGALFAVVTAATAINGCAAAKDAQGAAQGCSGLDVKVSAQAAVKAFADAAATLQTKAAAVEAKFLDVCNKMNASLGLDTTQTTAKDAC